MVDRSLEQEKGEVEQISGRKWIMDRCGQVEAGMFKMARGEVEQLIEDITLVVQNRNTIILMSNK